jgi:hypothetical protein
MTVTFTDTELHYLQQMCGDRCTACQHSKHAHTRTAQRTMCDGCFVTGLRLRIDAWMLGLKEVKGE